MDTPDRAIAADPKPDTTMEAKNEGSDASSPLSDPPSSLETPETLRNANHGDTVQQNATQSDLSTYGTQASPSTTSGVASTDLNEADDQEDDGLPTNQDDSRAVWDRKVQKLLVGLEDEVGVDLLLNSGDHDDAECLAVKVIWQERRIADMAQQISRLEGKLRDMGAMTLEVLEKEIKETGSGEEE